MLFWKPNRRIYMSYDLMSDDSLRDEIAKMEAVLRARLVSQHQDRDERRKAQEEADEKRRLAVLKPYVAEYKELEKLCEKAVSLSTKITVPIDISAEVYLTVDSDPDEIDQMDVNVSIESFPGVNNNVRENIQEAISDIIGDMDTEDIQALFGESNAMKSLMARKKKLFDELGETEYDINDISDIVAEDR
jgi:hypothetical protein